LPTMLRPQVGNRPLKKVLHAQRELEKKSETDVYQNKKRGGSQHARKNQKKPQVIKIAREGGISRQLTRVQGLSPSRLDERD